MDEERYKEMYTQLFDALTDAMIEFKGVVEKLGRAQLYAQALYLESETKKETETPS